MQNLADILHRLIAKHGLLYGACIDQNGGVVATAGSLEKFVHPGLPSRLLGSHEEAQRTYEHVQERELLPAVWSQGEVIAFVDKATPQAVVVLIGFLEWGGDVHIIARTNDLVGASIDAEFAQHAA